VFTGLHTIDGTSGHIEQAALHSITDRHADRLAHADGPRRYHALQAVRALHGYRAHGVLTGELLGLPIPAPEPSGRVMCRCVIDVRQVLTGLEANVDHGSDDLDDLSDVLGHELVVLFVEGVLPVLRPRRYQKSYR
jgi:hypothetical protein